MEIRTDNQVFNLTRKVDLWVESLKLKEEFTDADFEELKQHLLDSVEELKKVGLSDEEAFLIARKRMGDAEDWEIDFGEMNKGIIHLKNSIFIFSGVLLFYIAFYFLRVSYKGLVIFMHHGLQFESIQIKEWITRFVISYHFVFILLFSTIYLFEERVLKLIDNFKITTQKAVGLFIMLVILAIAETSLIPFVNAIKKSSGLLSSYLFEMYSWINITFPAVFCITFVFFYIKYTKSSKIILK